MESINKKMEDTSKKELPIEDKQIEHLVISGGAITGFSIISALNHLLHKDFWKLENIKTIYGTSIGAFIGIILSLNYEWDVIYDYFVKRPWHNVITIDIQNYLNLVEDKGLVGFEFIDILLTPLFEAKNIDKNITLEEFYKYSNIEIHMYSIEINSFKIQDISYKTHPNLSVLTALCMTTAIPFIFKPVEYNNGWYIDGALLCNYPLNHCLEQTKCHPDNILAVRSYVTHNTRQISSDSSIFSYTGCLLDNITRIISNTDIQQSISNEVCIIAQKISYDTFYDTLQNQSKRIELINQGVNYAKLFIKYKLNNCANIDQSEASIVATVDQSEASIVATVDQSEAGIVTTVDQSGVSI
jgi:predicted acylesterase/phospholipase RssA